jgi:hypothetical protein
MSPAYYPCSCVFLIITTVVTALGGGAKLVAPREWDFIYHFLDCGTNHQKCEEAEGRGGAGMEGQRGDKGGVYSGGAHRATSNGVLMSMCELVASQINTLRELGSCEHAPARRSLR